MARLVLIAAILFSGCAGLGTSRWAMDDPAYAQKYSKPYEPGEKLPRMAKQSVDARFVDGQTGAYGGAGYASNPTSVGGQLGLFVYLKSWIEWRLGLAGLLGTGAESAFGGVEAGFRVQTPTRLAPFVGLGGFVGANRFDDPSADSGAFPPPEQKNSETESLAALVPEIGMHFWLTERHRLTPAGSYYVTTDGRDHDFWLVGLQYGLLFGN
jgi:hypothetical protein